MRQSTVLGEFLKRTLQRRALFACFSFSTPSLSVCVFQVTEFDPFMCIAFAFGRVSLTAFYCVFCSVRFFFIHPFCVLFNFLLDLSGFLSFLFILSSDLETIHSISVLQVATVMLFNTHT